VSWNFRDSFAALHHRNFRLFVIGQFISLIGFWMQNVGQSWLVYRLTHSAWYLGAITFSQQIPILLISFAAGGIIDRANRRRVIILTQTLALIQASILAYLTYTGRIQISQLFVLSAFIGAVSAFDLPARQSFLVQMVGKDDLVNAIAMNSSMFNAARMVGPAIAGLVIARWGESVCFFLNAVSYVAVLISLFLMKIQYSADPVRKQSLLNDLAEGFHYVRETKPIRVLLRTVGLFGIAGFPYIVLLPIFADSIFHRGASGLGILSTAVGVGALIGAFFLAGRKGIHGIGRVISFATFGFSISLFFFGISTLFWLSFVLLSFAGIFMMTSVASINTAIQSMIPDFLRGRVMSLFTTMLIGTAPVGSLIAGTIAKYFGARTTITTMSLCCLAAAFWFYRSLPGITSEARRLYQMQHPTPIVETQN
jgi:MFS family permease